MAVANAGVLYKYIQLTHVGYHVWDVPEQTSEDQVHNNKISMVQQLLYNPILSLVKASIMVFLFRLGDRRKIIRWSLIGLFLFNLGHMLGTFFGALTQCLPIHMYWNRWDPGETTAFSCFDEYAFSMATAAIAILTDVLILLIPIFMVWPLKLNRRKKIAVGSVLSLGWIVVIVACVRLKSFYDLWNNTDEDFTWSNSLGVVISIVEVNIAIILSCGPALNAILTRVAPRILGSKNATGRTNTFAYKDGYDMPSRTPKRFDMPSLPNSRNSGRPYRELDDDLGGSQDEIMNNDSLGAKRADIVARMIDNDQRGQGMYRQ